MHRRIASIGAVVLVVASCASSDPLAAGDCPRGFREGLDAWGDAGFNGTVAIIHGDESCIAATGLRDRESAIDMTADTVFAIGSVSKTVTAAAHEAAVVELLTSDGPVGAEERDILESTVGPIEDVTARGTIVDDNELRTYVTVTGGMSTLDLWYALTEQGAIAAAEGPTDPPSATFRQQRADTFVNIDPTGERPEVTLTFGTDTVVVDNGTTTTTARKMP